METLWANAVCPFLQLKCGTTAEENRTNRTEKGKLFFKKSTVV